MHPGKRNLITDVTGLTVGQAHDVAVRSGVTALVGDAPFTAAVHVMGGAPGTRETDLLDPDKTVEHVDSLVLSGGSVYGLDAASGVTDALRADGRGFPTRAAKVPIVPGAILFDLANGGDKSWEVNPYPALGRAAYAARSGDITLGSAGAGYGLSARDLKGGIGSSSLVLGNGLTVGALVAVNPHGSVISDADGRFWAAPFEFGAEFGGRGAAANFAPEEEATPKGNGIQNTTLGIVATDARLTPAQAQRLAIAAHDGIARAIVPAHTPLDGDLIFTAATGAREMRSPDYDLVRLCHAAAVCVARAVARGVYEAEAAPGDTLTTWRDTYG
ncbi:MAG: P1 family peptidase [Pseudomonadota bacterium]